MRSSISICIFLVLVLLAFSSAIGPTKQGGEEKNVSEIVDKMTIEEKVGQLMMPFIYGPPITPEAEELISKYHIGGVILFSWAGNLEDAEKTALFTNQLQQMQGIPLLIAIDQEGGRVTRVPGGTDFPGNMALGATKTENDAYAVGRITADEVKSIGVNMNFAPVLDVNNNPKNPVIGVRSFGEDPEVVAELGCAYIRGLQDHGVIATGKHFPGHGNTTVDSHTGLPIVSYDQKTLREIHLKPFQEAIDNGLDAIMTAHIIVEEIDPEYPATLSKPILTGLLREEMNFDGVIVTDAMTMAAISQHFGLERAVVRAVDAGADIILMPQVAGAALEETDKWVDLVKNAINAVVEAVKNGEISEERINESAIRILNLKAKYGLFERPFVDPKSTNQIIATPKHKSVELQIARDSITLIKDDAGLLPLKLDPAHRILLISPVGADRFSSAIANYHPSIDTIDVSGNPTELEIEKVLNETTKADVIILCTSRAQLSQYSNQARLVKDVIKTDKPLIVIALRTPYDITEFPEITTYLTGYGYRDCTVKALSEVLFGKIEATGQLPVSIPELFLYGIVTEATMSELPQPFALKDWRWIVEGRAFKRL